MTEYSIAHIVEKTGVSLEEALGHILALSKQNRLIRPEEVANLTLMLCGDDAKGINGQAIAIDGG